MDKRSWWVIDTPGCVVVVTLVFPDFPFTSPGGIRPFSSSFLFPDSLFHLGGAKGVGLGYMVLHCMHGRVSALGSWFFSFLSLLSVSRERTDMGLHSGNTTNRNRTTERRGITRWFGWAPGITATYLADRVNTEMGWWA